MSPLRAHSEMAPGPTSTSSRSATAAASSSRSRRNTSSRSPNIVFTFSTSALTYCSIWSRSSTSRRAAAASSTAQGLTLVHFSVQIQPCPTRKYTLHTINTPLHPLNTGYIIPMRTPSPTKCAQVELSSERV